MNRHPRSIFTRRWVAGSITTICFAAIASTAEGQARISCDAPEDQATLTHLPREAIEGIQPLYEAASYDEGGPFGRRLRGATVSVVPRRGLTQERLRYLDECGVESASKGSASTNWPPVPAGTTVRVRSGGDRFLVDFRAADDASAEEVLKAVQQYKK